LIDIDNAIIVDVEATTAIRQAEMLRQSAWSSAHSQALISIRPS
jgi:hypothetical protein